MRAFSSATIAASFSSCSSVISGSVAPPMKLVIVDAAFARASGKERRIPHRAERANFFAARDQKAEAFERVADLLAVIGTTQRRQRARRRCPKECARAGARRIQASAPPRRRASRSTTAQRMRTCSWPFRTMRISHAAPSAAAPPVLAKSTDTARSIVLQRVAKLCGHRARKRRHSVRETNRAAALRRAALWRAAISWRRAGRCRTGAPIHRAWERRP